MDATLLAAICKQYGKPIGGGYEIFIPNSVVASLPRSKDAMVQQTPDQQGFRLRYYPNITIQGEVVRAADTPTSPPEQPHIDEWA